MDNNAYRDVRILLAVENPIVRQGLQGAFLNHGLPRASEASGYDRLPPLLEEKAFDIILAATELGRFFVPDYLGQLRRGELPHHPLPIVIQFVGASDNEHVRRTIDSGPDAILQMPVAPAQLIARIKLLAEKRKKFVVTSDYVGPERRQAEHPGSLVVPTLEAPNPLALRLAGTPDAAIIEAVQTAADRLRLMRLARYSYELQWLSRALRQLFEQGGQDLGKLPPACERLTLLTAGLPRLLPKPAPGAILAATQRLARASAILLRDGFAADRRVIGGLAADVIALTRSLSQQLPADLQESASLNRPVAVAS
jgi:CheY-like chemotaxis protein